jgi:pimeloyl-ACP methyl ester carboxylesterase
MYLPLTQPHENSRCPRPDAVVAEAQNAGIDHLFLPGDGVALSCWHAASRGPSRAAALLLHGITYSTMTVFDIPIPGRPRNDMSLMLKLAERGVHAFGLDFAGYGLSEGRGEVANVDQYCRDVACVIEALRQRFTSIATLALAGWSWSSQIAARLTGERPDLVDGLIFWGGLWGGGRGPLASHIANPPVWPGKRRVNRRETAANNFARSPDLFPADVVAHYLEHCLWLDPSSPNDGFEHIKYLPLHDPKRITRPVLNVFGSREKDREPDLDEYVAQLPAALLWDVRIPDSDHYIQYGPHRDAFADLLVRFAIAPSHASTTRASNGSESQ